MAKACNICGGLILANNEVLGYGGPICSGHHATSIVSTPTHIGTLDGAKRPQATTPGGTNTKELLEILIELMNNKVFIGETVDKIQSILDEQTRLAREYDEHGNPMFRLNRYEAEAVCHLIKNVDPQRFNTGDWFSDVPFKIEKWLGDVGQSPAHPRAERST